MHILYPVPSSLACAICVADHGFHQGFGNVRSHSRFILQITLSNWARETEPEVQSIHSIIHGVTEGANADALRFFDMDKSYVTRWLRFACAPDFYINCWILIAVSCTVV
jgi:hypothetical protein